MVARNPVGYPGGLIFWTSDKKKTKKRPKNPPKNCILVGYTQPRMHCTTSATIAMGLVPIAGLSALGVTVTVPGGIRSPDLPISRRVLYRHRCLGPRNSGARSMHLSFRLEWGDLKYKKEPPGFQPGSWAWKGRALPPRPLTSGI